MYKIVAQVEADGDKKSIYDLKETLLRTCQQHSCKVEMTVSSSEGFQEMMSTSFSSFTPEESGMSSDDIIDMTLTGDEMFELLEHKEQGESK